MAALRAGRGAAFAFSKVRVVCAGGLGASPALVVRSFHVPRSGRIHFLARGCSRRTLRSRGGRVRGRTRRIVRGDYRYRGDGAGAIAAARGRANFRGESRAGRGDFAGLEAAEQTDEVGP